MGVGMTTCLHSGTGYLCRDVEAEDGHHVEGYAVFGKNKDNAGEAGPLSEYKDLWKLPVGGSQCSSPEKTQPWQQASYSSTRPDENFVDLSGSADIFSPVLWNSNLPQPCNGDGSQKCCKPQTPGQLDCLAPAPIIFLDIDGVLHSTGATFRELFGAKQLEDLQRITSATSAQIVLSTAWRLTASSTQRVFHELQQAGIPLPISSTPNLRPGTINGRAEEIRAWLASHPNLVLRGQWLAIDDIPLCPDLPEGNVIKTDCLIGLTAKLADEAIQKLSLLAEQHVQPTRNGGQICGF